jgi:hypothetical protein
MRSFVSVVLVLVLGFAVPAAASQDYKFAGTYAVEGENPGGEGAYQGEATIVATGATYRVEWYIGEQLFVGTGIGYGDILAVGYDGGTALYQVREDGALYGVWSYTDGDTLGAEVLTPILGQ